MKPRRSSQKEQQQDDVLIAAAFVIPIVFIPIVGALSRVNYSCRNLLPH